MNKKVTTFLIILVIACLFPYYKIISMGMEEAKFYVVLLMWIPALVAIITNIIFEKRFPSFGIKRILTKELSVAYAIPLISSIIVYGLVYITGLGKAQAPSDSLGIVGNFFVYAIPGVVMSMTTAIGEELGWRGFLVPELMKSYSYVKTSLIVGTMWLIYHLPVLIFSNYNNGVSVVSSAIFFGISVFAITFIANLLTIRSKSVWPAIMLHATHNVIIQGYFDPMTVDTGITKFITTEFGCGLAIIYTLFAMFLYLKLNKNMEIKNNI